MDEPTAWQDINPAVSAQQPARPSPCSDQTDHRKTFRNELAACLTLVAPVGMTEEARRDWFAVAWDTLKHIPPDILVIGARKARLQCDHPSKIVPTIIAETRESMRLRRESKDWQRPLAITGPEPEYCSAEEAAKILAQFGLKHDPDTAA